MGDIIRIREPREGNPTYINSYGPRCGNCGRDHWFVGEKGWVCSGCGAIRSRV